MSERLAGYIYKSVKPSIAVPKHSISLGHIIQLQDTRILSTKSRYKDWMINTATEIELHPNNMIREGGLCLSRLWKPLIHSLKGCRNPPHQQVAVPLSSGHELAGQFCPFSPTHW
jgi:hypothetical protein